MNKAKILVVEDESLIALEIEGYLLELNFNVVGIVNTGKKAIDAVKLEQPDMILMDIRIKGAIDGIETAKIIRSQFNLPVVFLTAFMDDERLEKAKLTMPFGYLLKPVQKRELKVTLEMALHMAEADLSRSKAEQALRNSEENLRITLASIGDAVISTDLKGNITNMNTVAEKLTGWTLEEARGINLDLVFNIINEKSKEPVESPVKKVLETGQIIGLANHTLLITKQGNEIPISDSGAPIVDASGETIGVVLVFRDQTKERELLNRLEESEEKYKTAFKTSPDAVNINTMDGTYLDVNDGFTQLTGFLKDDVIDKNSSEVNIWAKPEDRVRLIEGLEMAGFIQNLETEFRCKDNSIKIGLMSASIIKINDKPHILSVTRDISNRKKAEKELQEQKDLLELITQTIPIGITTVNNQGKITFANKAAESILNLDEKSITQKTYNDPTWKITDINGGPFPEEQLPFRQVMEKQKAVIDIQHGIRWSDDQLRILSINSAPLLDQDGRLTGIINSLNDITERVRAEQQIHRLLTEKETLLKEVHHRIKNNMVMVQSLLTLQAYSIENDEIVAVLENAKDRLQSMMLLYDKLYRSDDFTRMSIKKYLPELIDEIIGNCTCHAQLDIIKEVEDVVLDANHLSTIGIIINELLTNCLKYAFVNRSQGKIKISASKSDNLFRLMVEDDGVGFRDTFRKGVSEGFGLKLVDLMTAQLQGKLRIEKDNGTRFIIEMEIRSK